MKIFHVSQCALGGRVSSIEEGVDENSRHSLLLGHPNDRLQVMLGGVDAAGRKQAEEVERPPIALGLPDGRVEGLVAEKGAILDRSVDAHEVLEDDPPGAEVGVPDLGIPHLPLGQTHCEARGVEGRVGIALVEEVDVRGIGQGDGVVLPLLS